MRSRWIWAFVVMGILVVAGAAFTVTRLGGPTGDMQQLQVTPPTDEEKERQEIEIAASEGELKEAVRHADGWVVRFEQEVSEIAEDALMQHAHTFFRDLDRTGVDIRLAGFVAITNTLRDVWGNSLSDVPVVRIEVERDTFERINWQGFQPEDFPRVADYFWIHEIVERKEEEEAAQDEQQGQEQEGGGGGGGNGGGGGGGM